MPPEMGIFVWKYERNGPSFFRRALRCLPPGYWTETLLADGALEKAVSNSSRPTPPCMRVSLKRARDLRWVRCEWREPPGRLCPSKSSEDAIDASVVSSPSAVPDFAPASGTRLMGAFCRFSYPDLTRLFDTDSLLSTIQG